MGIPSGAFPGASAGTTPPIYPVGSSGNQLQATGFIPEDLGDVRVTTK